MKRKKILAFFLIIILCTVFFMGTAFVFSRKVLLGVDVPKTDVPYVDGKFLPSDTTVLLTFSDDSCAVIELLFSKNFTNILLLNSFKEKDFSKYGYFPEHTVACDYSFLMKFIDTLGGIEIDGEDYVLTGVQVCNLLADEQSFTAKTDIINGVMNKISKNGLSEDSLYCIIDNTVTTLSVPACYNWNIWVGKCFSSYNIVDGRKKLDSNP